MNSIMFLIRRELCPRIIIHTDEWGQTISVANLSDMRRAGSGLVRRRRRLRLTLADMGIRAVLFGIGTAVQEAALRRERAGLLGAHATRVGALAGLWQGAVDVVAVVVRAAVKGVLAFALAVVAALLLARVALHLVAVAVLAALIARLCLAGTLPVLASLDVAVIALTVAVGDLLACLLGGRTTSLGLAEALVGLALDVRPSTSTHRSWTVCRRFAAWRIRTSRTPRTPRAAAVAIVAIVWAVGWSLRVAILVCLLAAVLDAVLALRTLLNYFTVL